MRDSWGKGNWIHTKGTGLSLNWPSRILTTTGALWTQKVEQGDKELRLKPNREEAQRSLTQVWSRRESLLLSGTVLGARDPMAMRQTRSLTLCSSKGITHTRFFVWREKRNQNRGRGRRARSRKGITKARGSMLTSRAEVPLSPEKADSDSGHVSSSQSRRRCNIPWRGPA